MAVPVRERVSYANVAAPLDVSRRTRGHGGCGLGLRLGGEAPLSGRSPNIEALGATVFCEAVGQTLWSVLETDGPRQSADRLQFWQREVILAVSGHFTVCPSNG